MLGIIGRLSFGVLITAFALAPAAKAADRAAQRQQFQFYASVDHEQEKVETQKFCVDPQYRIVAFQYRETTRNGDQTGVRSAEVMKEHPSCLLISAYVKGKGVTRVGNLVLDRRGRGWLGLDVTVEVAPVDRGAKDVKSRPKRRIPDAPMSPAPVPRGTTISPNVEVSPTR